MDARRRSTLVFEAPRPNTDDGADSIHQGVQNVAERPKKQYQAVLTTWSGSTKNWMLACKKTPHSFIPEFSQELPQELSRAAGVIGS